MKLKGIEVLNSSPMKLVQDKGDLLISTTPDFHGINPIGGGILVNPIIDKESILEEDDLIYTQRCNYHLFEFAPLSSSPLILNSPHYDSTSNNCTNYRKLKARYYNHIPNLSFYDAPNQELLKHWNYLKYEIHFETWIQFSRDGIVKPLGVFKWNLFIEVKKKNSQWEVIKSSHSSKEEIEKSFMLKKETDSPLDLSNLPHLFSTVESWLISNKQLK